MLIPLFFAILKFSSTKHLYNILIVWAGERPGWALAPRVYVLKEAQVISHVQTTGCSYNRSGRVAVILLQPGPSRASAGPGVFHSNGPQ